MRNLLNLNMKLPRNTSKICKTFVNVYRQHLLNKFPSSNCLDYLSFSSHHHPVGTRNQRLSCLSNSNYYGNSNLNLALSGTTWKYFHTSCVASFENNNCKPPFLLAGQYHDKTAIVDCHGTFSYSDILQRSTALQFEILEILNVGRIGKLRGERIALLTDQDVSYVIGQFATWMADGVCIPLCTSHPISEWRYFLTDAECSLLLVAQRFAEQILPIAEDLGIAVKVLPKIDLETEGSGSDNQMSSTKNLKRYETFSRLDLEYDGVEWRDKPALIVYTSGTTGRPKGVVLTHGNLSAMISGMVASWEWTDRDVILHVLPLHHVHGIVNVLLTPLSCGATCVMETKFDAKRTWDLLTSPSIAGIDQGISVFMAVPTIYAKMIQHYQEHMQGQRSTSHLRDTLERKIRLMVSGSAALPQPVSDLWLELTGHRLLERYGMTEIGMALTNPLHGDRLVGCVGQPFPDVSVRIVEPNPESPTGYDVIVEGDRSHTAVTTGCEGKSGELMVKGPNVFSQYWNKVKATEDAFTSDGWFKTDDTCLFEKGVYRIVGRSSVDIIKSGGYKISALDVERHLLGHPEIVDVAVVGVPDDVWGQKVAAVVMTSGDKPLELQDLREWCREVLPLYQTPALLKCLPSIPRNAMGKVNKKELITIVFPELVQN